MTLQREAIEALLERSGRSQLPLRRAFLQVRGVRPARGGPLAAFGKRESAIDLYLLAVAVASKPPWDVSLPNRVWARLLGTGEDASGSTLVARQWTWLEAQQLVTTERDGRNRRITLLREDGSGRAYSHPGVSAGGAPAEGDYFAVPFTYWRMGWDARLSMAGKLTLLIALSLRDDFILPVEHAARWYSLSSTRLSNGLAELRTVQLLRMRAERIAAPLTERGFTFERHYTVGPRFRAEPSRPLVEALAAAVETRPEYPWFEIAGDKIVQLGADTNDIISATRDHVRALNHAGAIEMDRSKAPQWIFRLQPPKQPSAPDPT